jgi:hypothetical protein
VAGTLGAATATGTWVGVAGATAAATLVDCAGAAAVAAGAAMAEIVVAAGAAAVLELPTGAAVAVEAGVDVAAAAVLPPSWRTTGDEVGAEAVVTGVSETPPATFSGMVTRTPRSATVVLVVAEAACVGALAPVSAAMAGPAHAVSMAAAATAATIALPAIARLPTRPVSNLPTVPNVDSDRAWNDVRPGSLGLATDAVTISVRGSLPPHCLHIVWRPLQGIHVA